MLKLFKSNNLYSRKTKYHLKFVIKLTFQVERIMYIFEIGYFKFKVRLNILYKFKNS